MTLDLNTIARRLTDEHNIVAHVAATGGGTYTLCAGPSHTDDDGTHRYAALVGPGYTHDGRTVVDAGENVVTDDDPDAGPAAENLDSEDKIITAVVNLTAVEYPCDDCGAAAGQPCEWQCSTNASD